MSNCNRSPTPMDQQRPLPGADNDNFLKTAPNRQAIGCFMFFMIGTRADLTYAIETLSQHCADFRKAHWTAVKRVLRYVKSTPTLGIELDKCASPLFSPALRDAGWKVASSLASRQVVLCFSFAAVWSVGHRESQQWLQRPRARQNILLCVRRARKLHGWGAF